MISFSGSGWLALLVWVAMVLFSGLVAWMVTLVIGGETPHREEDPHGDSPRQILDQRLVRGEMNRDEYRRLRVLLGLDRSPVSSRGAG